MTAQAIVCAVSALLVFVGQAFPALAQAPRNVELRHANLGWDGRSVTHPCHADAADTQGLKATLIEHEKTRIGFKNKIRFGVFSGGELSGGRIRNAAPSSLLEIIARRLGNEGSGDEAAALVYDLGIWKEQYSLCVWMLSPKGIEVAVTVPIAENSPFRAISAATMVRSGLDVEGRAAARAPQPLGNEAEHPAPAIEHLSQELMDKAWSLSPVIAAKLRDSSAKRLLILPVSDIGFVPFAALPLGGEQLIDRFALVLLPDVEALLGLSSEAQRWGHRQMVSVVVGDPDLSQDRRFRFPPLPGARAEAEEVATLLGAHPVLGEEATRGRVLAGLETSRNASVIYFATHALSDPVNPMDGSFLALAGDHLYGRDIKGLLFHNNPLVVMSACQTGLGKVFEGGTFGLVRAWYHVGALQIVMSLWNIDDNATKDLMLTFMRRLKTGELTEFALRDAMLATRQKYVDPALWASVALFGLPSKASVRLEPTPPLAGPPRGPQTPLTASVATVPSGAMQRAILYEEEDPQYPGGRKFSGSVVWGTALAVNAERQQTELRAEIAIPERKLSVIWSLQRNKDPALPASHVLELKFTGPADVHGGGIQNVPGILVKTSEEVRGTPLNALQVNLSGDDFLVGLSIGNVQSNETLLKEGRCFDIPIVYGDGHRAILTIEKGGAGDRAFGEVFSAWSATGIATGGSIGAPPPAMQPPITQPGKRRSNKKSALVDWKGEIWRR